LKPIFEILWNLKKYKFKLWILNPSGWNLFETRDWDVVLNSVVGSALRVYNNMKQNIKIADEVVAGVKQNWLGYFGRMYD